MLKCTEHPTLSQHPGTFMFRGNVPISHVVQFVTSFRSQMYRNNIGTEIILNKRPLGLTAPLSNCLYYTNDVYLSMIHSQINTQLSRFDLSMPRCYDLLYVFHAKFDKSCDLDLTLKGYPMSNVSR